MLLFVIPYQKVLPNILCIMIECVHYTFLIFWYQLLCSIPEYCSMTFNGPSQHLDINEYWPLQITIKYLNLNTLVQLMHCFFYYYYLPKIICPGVKNYCQCMWSLGFEKQIEIYLWQNTILAGTLTEVRTGISVQFLASSAVRGPTHSKFTRSHWVPVEGSSLLMDALNKTCLTHPWTDLGEGGMVVDVGFPATHQTHGNVVVV